MPTDTKVMATVGIDPRSEGGFGIDAGLEISLPGTPKPEAEALVAKPHQVCPCSNATRNDLPVRLTVVRLRVSQAPPSHNAARWPPFPATILPASSARRTSAQICQVHVSGRVAGALSCMRGRGLAGSRCRS